MEIEHTSWTADAGWTPDPPGKLGDRANLVLTFGNRRNVGCKTQAGRLSMLYPNARIFGCSTAGEISDTKVSDDTLVVTAIRFEHTRIAGAQSTVESADDSFTCGRDLAASIPAADLTHVFVIADGLKVNGSDLVRGLASQLPSSVGITGGLAGDGSHFEETCVIWDDRMLDGGVGIIGFYGPRLHVGYGSLGGWDSFGPERLITRSRGNVLYEMDGRSALELYKHYLGDHADDLPASGLLFPLSVRTADGDAGVVRTILTVDEGEQSMTFAGDVPEGAYARLMKANFDRLIDGAVGAAKTSQIPLSGSSAELAVLISCVGRKMVLGQRIEEETEGVRDVLGPGSVLTGFYSYGEISPFTPSAKCELHNQTMTITTFREN